MSNQRENEKDMKKARTPIYIGRKSKVECPLCGGVNVPVSETVTPGLKKVKCIKCGEVFLVEVEMPAPLSSDTTDIFPEIKESKGRIMIMRRWWLPKVYPLNVGKNLIGRADADMSSDISIRNDNEISRRSIEIEVTKADIGGWFITLKVLKAANVVLHNDVELSEGDCVSLSYGDTIVLGHTKLRFEK